MADSSTTISVPTTNSEPPSKDTINSFTRTLCERIKLEIKFSNSSWKHNRISRPTPAVLRRCLQTLIMEHNTYSALCRQQEKRSTLSHLEMLDKTARRLTLELCGFLVFDVLTLTGEKFRSGDYRVLIRRTAADSAEDLWWQDFWKLSDRLSAKNVQVSAEHGSIRATPGAVATVQLFRYEKSFFSTRVNRRLLRSFEQPIEEFVRLVDVTFTATNPNLSLTITSVWMPAEPTQPPTSPTETPVTPTPDDTVSRGG